MTPNIPTVARISATTPNKPSSQVRNLGSATDEASTSGMDATSVTGKFGSIPRTTWRTAAATAEADCVVFTTTGEPQNGCCAYGTYTIGPGALCSETSCTSATMPTIRRTTLLSGGKLMPISLPIGSWLGK